jgi:SAM-dependent methyltransferase
MMDNTRLQAEEHPLVFSDTFSSLPEYCLHLMHLRAYEEVAPLAKDKAVLDLGCNNGYGTNELARVAHRAVGLDVSETAVADARRRFGGAGPEFRVFDGNQIPFDDGTFSTVTSFQVIEHVVDTGAYLDEIARVLQPDGTAVFTTPNAAIRLDPGMKPWNRFHVQEFQAGQLEDLLRTAFPSVVVRGLFATEDVYSIEYERCQSALREARHAAGRRRRPQPPWRRLAKAALPKSAVDILRARRHRLKAKPLDSAVQSRYSTRDLFYRDSDLSRALDLMAICRKRRAPRG